MRAYEFSAGLALMAVLGTASLHGHTRTAPQPVAPLAADNSGANQALLQSATGRTADTQPDDEADRVAAAQIRRALCADDLLSLYAQNVKVIVSGGVVTLVGPVRSDAERQAVAFDAAIVMHGKSIVNRCTIV
jgi:osmotically-inducible protein OsmY